jgi:hypothetical protein
MLEVEVEEFYHRVPRHALGRLAGSGFSLD